MVFGGSPLHGSHSHKVGQGRTRDTLDATSGAQRLQLQSPYGEFQYGDKQYGASAMTDSDTHAMNGTGRGAGAGGEGEGEGQGEGEGEEKNSYVGAGAGAGQEGEGMGKAGRDPASATGGAVGAFGEFNESSTLESAPQKQRPKSASATQVCMWGGGEVGEGGYVSCVACIVCVLCLNPLPSSPPPVAVRTSCRTRHIQHRKNHSTGSSAVRVTTSTAVCIGYFFVKNNRRPNCRTTAGT